MNLPLNELAKRRKQLMRMIGNEGVAILPSSPIRSRNNDVEYPYRQDSDFLYLTGFDEPQAVMVLVPGRAQGEYILFCRENDLNQEIWHGRRLGVERASEVLGVDDAFPIDDIDEILPGLIDDREAVYYNVGLDTDFDQRLMGWVNQIRRQKRAGKQAPHEFISLEYLLHDMRLYKSRTEVKYMREAAKVTHEAHVRAMQATAPGKYEYEVEAELLYSFQRHGMGTAYPSIVGGGRNGCILHYTENSDVLNDGDLLLIDAGAEHRMGYASDVTRTFPVNGEFSAPQKELYEIVLEAQAAAIKACVPGNHWDDPHMAAVKVLTKGLINVGLLKGTPAALVKSGAYRDFYMHRTGHWLGLDVHDVGDYKLDDEWRLLEPGMVLTVEPGLYVSEHIKGVPKRYKNIGIRIEDDVLVTKDGFDVLTASIPKTVDDIEAVMAV